MTTHWLRTLGLPLRSPRATWAAAAAVFAYYALSMSRDMSVFDSPELALVAMQGGLGHPVGQPLHTVLGYVLAHVPGLPSLVGVNLLSALPGALLVVPAMSIADGWAGASNPRRNWVPAAVLAVWALAEPAWETATRVEVYALASLLALWSVAKVLATLRAEVVGVRGALFAAGVALGLSASTNPYVAIVAALAVMPAVLRALATRRLGPLPAVMAVLGGVVGLVPYVYVPLVAGREDVFVWSSPATSSTLSAYLRGQDYASARTLSFGGWVEHLGAWWGWAAATGVLGQVLVGLLASSRFVWARRSGALAFVVALVLAIALVASNTVWEPDIPDYVSYLVPALWLGGAAAAALASELVRADQTRALAALGVLVVLSVFFVAPAPGLRTRAHDHVSRTLAAAALDDLPKGAILVADGGHWIAPLLYLQQAEHRRKDVILVPTGFASSSWYWEFLFRQHPELKAPRLRGPGGRAGRVLRLATQNPGREVHVTTFEEAQTLGRAPCLLGATYTFGEACQRDAKRDMVRELRRMAEQVQRGSPTSDNLVAAVAFDRGRALLAMGRPKRAVETLLSGVMSSRVPDVNLKAVDWAAAPVGWPRVDWRRAKPVGDPARNLFVAAIALGQAGAEADALALIRAAADEGLPEALEWLERAQAASGLASSARKRSAMGSPGETP